MEETVTALFEKRVRDTPDQTALCFKQAGQWRQITWEAYGERVSRFAKALIALGVGKGDRVALMGSNTPEWFVADMAIMTMGAVSVPVYATNSGEQICYILDHSESKVFVVEEIGYFLRIESLLDRIPGLEKVVLLKGNAPAGRDLLIEFPLLEKKAESTPPEALHKHRASVTPDTPATFIYTSGTTGPPKAVILTHRNSVTAARNVHMTLKTRARQSISCTYLSLAHVAERTVNLFSPLLDGRIVFFMGGYEKFIEELKEIRPTIWLGVPRVWEKIHEGVIEALQALPARKQRLTSWALRVGGKYNWQKYEKKRIPLGLQLGYRTARALVIRRLLAGLGLDRTEIFVTGGAPTSKEILDFFMSVGIWLQDVYGQTEGHGTTSFATKDAIRFGSAGKPYPLVQVRIAEDGEILVKGDNVSPGYYKDPELTAETFRDGWLHSGDLGYLDPDGFLWITGRKKDIIITSGGKNISPAGIETALMSSPLVEHAVVVGDGRKYLTALLTLNEEEARKIVASRGSEPSPTEDLSRNEAVRESVERHVQEVNRGLSRVEQIKKFTILARPFSVEGGELTHLLKIRRGVVQEKYAKEIEKMYS